MKKTILHKKSNRPMNRPAGVTLIEMCIVLLLLTVLMAIALPSVMRARTNTQIKACKSHLTHMQEAKQRWAMENRKDAQDTPRIDELMPTYLKVWPECPAGGEYTIENVDTSPKCSLGEEHAIK